MASLLYGAGLRLKECLRLRVKDLDFGYQQIVVRDAKGNQDRVTVLPTTLVEPLKTQIAQAKTLHLRDLNAGFGRVYLPFARAKVPECQPRMGLAICLSGCYTEP
jgi:integrase